ncbi:MAG: hypothetical protein KKI08_23320 [Armatimonadetes bacterium]|nr:hypothetical protein [Armatimonadota bacterium]
MRVLSLVLLSFAMSAALAAPVLTRAPITYVLDYGSKHLGYNQWVADTIAAKPQLLHLGKDVVMTHNWGPIQALGGENQAYGKGDSVRRLTLEETKQRRDGLTDMVRRLHAGGVTMVMPYICAMTIGGDPDKRTGFWEFYDHWDEYAGEFKLGPRPAEDPITWLQVEPDGKPHFFYRLTDGKYPPYEPNIRYAVCMNNPHWRYWSEQVTRMCAEVGYDGVFVDNAGSQRCYCRYCQQAFGEWLKARYHGRPKDYYAGQPILLTDDLKQGLAAVDSRRFWADSFSKHLMALKAAGEKVRQPFYVFPNGGESRPEHVWGGYMPVDYLMFERSLGDFGTNPGMAGRRIVRDIKLRHMNNNIFENKLTQCAGGNVRPLLLTRGGYPALNPDWDLNPDAAALGMAESAAYGNGGGFLIRPDYATFGDVLRQYRGFFEREAALYEGNWGYAQVQLACFPYQKMYGNLPHISRVRSLTDALGECHVLFDYNTRWPGFHFPELQQYRLIILPDVKYMDVGWADQLVQYLKAGGKAIIVGENATMGAELPRPQISPFASLTQDGRMHTLGQGQYVSCALPPNGKQLWAILGQLGLQDLALCPPDANQHVRFNAFARADGKTLYFHVLNYDVPLGATARLEHPREGLKLRLPLPPGASVKRAVVHDPDKAEAAKVEIGADGTVALPPLRVYEVVEVGL